MTLLDRKRNEDVYISELNTLIRAVKYNWLTILKD